MFDFECVRCGETDYIEEYIDNLEVRCTECGVYYPLVHGVIPLIHEEELTEEPRHDNIKEEKERRKRSRGEL